MGQLILFLLRSIASAYASMPGSIRTAAGNALGMVLSGLRMRHSVIQQNLELAFPRPDQAGLRKALSLDAYRHLGHLVFEIMMLLGPMKKFVLENSELRGLEHWKEAKARGKGVIFLSSHVGNWEIMAATGALHGGMDLMLVTKHLKPEWLHQAIEAGRLACGVSATYEPRTLKDVLRHLSNNGTVGMVQDQYAGPPVGVRVPVFGVPVGTTGAIAAIAKRTGAVVLPVVNYRLPNGRVIVDIRSPVEWEPHPDSTHEIALNTARYSSLLERDIYQYPEQWLWIHRRFKGDLSPLRENEWSEGRART